MFYNPLLAEEIGAMLISIRVNRCMLLCEVVNYESLGYMLSRTQVL